ncbi:Panacea domain-containing protein [Bacteroides fragilis]|uniref:Panacea domain-containing protein n=1 Tax=Bacteroides fragilis TaxID=817 RepID=UPI00202FA601|nr:Panacea domain-containing protein [Bacteroides fragilis]MCM0314255.1 SocA family protein [Bacteroides fragilis]
MVSLGVQVNKELVGNIIILLAEKCAPLYHTKLIKMLYLIDEKAIKDSGVPITWLDYKVWQYGPVDPAIFHIKDNFGEYVSAVVNSEYNGVSTTIIKPLRKFNDDEFSDYDLDIINEVIEECKDKKACELVHITHKPGSPWDIAKKRNELDFSIANISDAKVDMGVLIESSPEKQARYKEAYDHMAFMSVLKSKVV